MFGGSPWIRKSSRDEVACMIVNRALARSQSSLGNDFDRLVVQISLANLPLKLVIMSNHTIPYSVINAQPYHNRDLVQMQPAPGYTVARVFAPNFKHRKRIVPRRPRRSDADKPPAPMSWMQRLKRVFAIDIENCPERRLSRHDGLRACSQEALPACRSARAAANSGWRQWLP